MRSSPALRPCLVCGQPSRGPRCHAHALPPRGRAQHELSLQVRAEEHLCWLCGKQPTPDDPLTLDHVIPRTADRRLEPRTSRSLELQQAARYSPAQWAWEGVPHSREPPGHARRVPRGSRKSYGCELRALGKLMAGKLPKQAKPPEALRRRNAPEQWVALPAEGCLLPIPAWPDGKPTEEQAALWSRLWRLPLALWWHDQAIEPSVVARYVELRFTKPALAVLSRIESELGLTPASLMRLRLIVDRPEPEPVLGEDPYAHLRSELRQAEVSR
jgi:hypothetical protein